MLTRTNLPRAGIETPMPWLRSMLRYSLGGGSAFASATRASDGVGCSVETQAETAKAPAPASSIMPARTAHIFPKPNMVRAPPAVRQQVAAFKSGKRRYAVEVAA